MSSPVLIPIRSGQPAMQIPVRGVCGHVTDWVPDRCRDGHVSEPIGNGLVKCRVCGLRETV